MIFWLQTTGMRWLAAAVVGGALGLSTIAGAESDSASHTSADPSSHPAPHALAGQWWLKSVFDGAGTAIWLGGGQDEPITMTVKADGDIHTLAACNSYFGSFGAATGLNVALDPPLMMTTRIMCWGDYPPVVRFERIARFDRGPVELTLFDADDRRVATYIDMTAMAEALTLARDRERGE